MHIAVEPSDICNLDCPSCMREKPGRGFMSPITFERMMEKLDGEVESVFLYGRGESTLSPYLPDLTEIAMKYGCDTRLSINTCVPLKKRYVARLLHSVSLFKICVDGWDQESLNWYRRGGNWKVLLQNLETISEVNPCKAVKEMCVLTFKYVEGKEHIFRRLAREYKMDRICWTLPIINWKMKLNEAEAEEWLATNPNYQRYKLVNGVWQHKTSRFCMPDPFVCVDGTVLGCCRDRYATAPVGNILTDDVKKIRRRLFWFWLKALRHRFEFCRTCCWDTNLPVEIWEKV